MEDKKPSVLPAPPNLIAALRAGFDAVANHIIIILFPVLLDLFIWLGPHLKVKRLFDELVSLVADNPGAEQSQSGAAMALGQDALQQMAEQMNLLSTLRSFPVGIPSLMTSKLPINTPAGTPLAWNVNDTGLVLILWILLMVVGVTLGSLYFSVVAQAAINGEVRWRQAVVALPWLAYQSLALTIGVGLLLLVISLPVICALAMILSGGAALGEIGIMIYIAVVLWVAFPLVFSAHGLFTGQGNVLLSVRHSIRITRLTLPTTSLLFLAVLVLSEGMDILWRAPKDDSWLLLLGVAGHAFLTTGLLAATFVYYRDADRWTRQMLERFRRQAPVA